MWCCRCVGISSLCPWVPRIRMKPVRPVGCEEEGGGDSGGQACNDLLSSPQARRYRVVPGTEPRGQNTVPRTLSGTQSSGTPANRLRVRASLRFGLGPGLCGHGDAAHQRPGRLRPRREGLPNWGQVQQRMNGDQVVLFTVQMGTRTGPSPVLDAAAQPGPNRLVLDRACRRKQVHLVHEKRVATRTEHAVPAARNHHHPIHRTRATPPITCQSAPTAAQASPHTAASAPPSAGTPAGAPG